MEAPNRYCSTNKWLFFRCKVPQRAFIHYGGHVKPWQDKSLPCSFPATPPRAHNSFHCCNYQLSRAFREFIAITVIPMSLSHMTAVPLQFRSPNPGRYSTHRSFVAEEGEGGREDASHVDDTDNLCRHCCNSVNAAWSNTSGVLPSKLRYHTCIIMFPNE